MEALDHHFGLDKPLWRQFAQYVVGDFDADGQFVCGLVCGNMGPSYQVRGRAVQERLFGIPEGGKLWDSLRNALDPGLPGVN